MKDQFVSRAGQKLQHALLEFKIDVREKTCADFGCSTGGFTDCLLQNGAKKVYAVDTAYGELDWNLRNDKRVVVMEKTNALHVELPELVDFISIDVGWTPQKLILPKALEVITKEGDIVSLLKPHYEAEKNWLRKGTLLEEYVPRVIEKVKEELSGFNLIIKGIVDSPILGNKGKNTEYLMWIKKLGI